MTLDPSTRNELLRYLDGEITITEFRRFMRPTTWKLGDPQTRAASPLARRVALYIAEFNQGHRTEEELRRLFTDAAATVQIEAAQSLYEILLWSAAETTAAVVRSAGVRTAPEEEFAQEASQNRRTEHRTTKAPRGLAQSR